jgi:hypothetical protein
LRELAPKIKECKETLSAQAVGNALYGLQNMSSDVDEVRSVLRELAPKVKECKEPLDAQAVGNALYGLQNMSSDEDEVRSVLRELAPKVKECKDTLSAQEVGNAMFGLRNIYIDLTWIPLLRNLLESLFNLNASNTLNELVSVYQSIAIVLNPSCKFATSIEESPLYNDLVKQKIRLHDVLGRHPEKSSNENKPKNKSEAKYMSMISEKFSQSPDVQVSSNVLLHGFEADIVIRKTSIVDGKEVVAVLNIELDGPSHKHDLSKKHFCELRDDYLRREHDIRIERVELRTMKDSDIHKIINSLCFK